MKGGFDHVSEEDQTYDRIEMLKAFDETKAGVKGLIDEYSSGKKLLKIPKIFVRPTDELAEELTYKKIQIQVPVIDLSDIQNPDRRKQIVEEVRVASETWGFFQVVNHGIPLTVLDEMIAGVREFNDQDIEEKKKYYSRDLSRRVKFRSNHDLFTSRTASWRDTLTVSFSDQLNTDELPDSCRDSTVEYSRNIVTLGNTILELLSEALGLEPDHLYKMECTKVHQISSHYYPACPEPELTLGTTKHSDPGFITILLQNQIVTSLQILYKNQWVDIEPIQGAFVINIGDLLQLVSNGKFKSSEHRVVASHIGPRISVACFFSGPVSEEKKIYGPIEELLSEENPAIYREVLLGEYIVKFVTTGLDNYRALNYYKV